jgi:hypothetical protein
LKNNMSSLSLYMFELKKYSVEFLNKLLFLMLSYNLKSRTKLGVFNYSTSRWDFQLHLLANYNCTLSSSLTNNTQKLRNWYHLPKQHNFNPLKLQTWLQKLLRSFDRLHIYNFHLGIDYQEYILIFPLWSSIRRLLLKQRDRIIPHISLLYNYHKRRSCSIQTH